MIGEVDQFSAPVLVHDDAIYLHEGAQFHVERLDWEEKRAYVHPIEVDHYTTAETRHSVVVLERYAGPDGGHCAHSYGEVRVSRLATLYKKIRFLTHETIGAGPIHLPEQDIHTVAYWQAFAPGAVASMSRGELETGLHGLVGALHQAACLLCMCDPRDLGTHAELRGASAPGSSGIPATLSSRPVSDSVEYAAGWRPGAADLRAAGLPGSPTVYLYDSTPGGIGLTERCHARRSELVLAATRLVEGCGCAAGCPSCVGPGAAGVDARSATRRLLGLAAEE